MKQIKYICIAAAALVLSTVAVSASSDIKVSKLMAQKTSEPSEILMNSYRYMGKLKRFSIDAITTNEDMYGDKMLVTYTHHIHMDVIRPNLLHIELNGDIKNRSYYINDGHFTVYDKNTNYYGTLEVPQKIDHALDHLFEKFNIKTSLANILYTDLDKRIPPKTKGYYFGILDVKDTPCHHIGFVTPTQEFQVWIAVGKHPVIRRFTVIDKTEILRPRSSTVLKWDLKPNLKPNSFVFEKPKGAVQINIEPAVKQEAK